MGAGTTRVTGTSDARVVTQAKAAQVHQSAARMSDPMLGLCVLVAHSRTLARNDRGFETTSAPTEETVGRTGSRADSGAHRDTASRFKTLLALRSRLCPVGATPECFQRVREPLGFDPMRWVKVMSILEHLKLKV